MEKKTYDGLKALRLRVANGTATFAERNRLKIIDKRIKKGKPVWISK